MEKVNWRNLKKVIPRPRCKIKVKNENVAIINNRILVSYLIARNEIVSSSLHKIRIALSLRIIIFTLNLISTRIQCFVGNVHKNSLIIFFCPHFLLPRK